MVEANARELVAITKATAPMVAITKETDQMEAVMFNKVIARMVAAISNKVIA
jgi:hypothetical protein